MTSEEEVPWKKSIARAMLEAEIMCGTVTEQSDAAILQLNNGEYQKYDKKRFKSNLRNLIGALKKRESLALFDNEAVANDRSLLPRPDATSSRNGLQYPFWDTSNARELLALDVGNNLHLTMKPKDLWNSRAEYKEFPREVFIKHIHQERAKRSKSLFWLKIEEQKKMKIKKNKKKCHMVQNYYHK